MLSPKIIKPILSSPPILVFGIYLLCFILHIVIPEKYTPGYVYSSETKEPLQYRNNAFKVLIAMVLLSLYVVDKDYVDGDVLYNTYWECVKYAAIYGTVLSTILFIQGRQKLNNNEINENAFTLTVTKKTYGAKEDHTEFKSRSMLEHFYCGYEFNPKFLAVDLKMYLYLIGAVMLELILMSIVFKHTQNTSDGNATRAMRCYFFCISWFVFEYMYFEEVHTYTYDLFRERVGYKLIWGCFCFYPFFYQVGAWCMVAENNSKKDVSLSMAFLCTFLFFCGWTLTRGANLQKHQYRKDPNNKWFKFLFFNVKQETLGSEGLRKRILVSGWWGLSRHINYLGEITQAFALALPGYLTTGSYIPFVYPIYYILLFVPRQIDDDKICEEKYGKDVWDEYISKVKYRIFPGIW